MKPVFVCEIGGIIGPDVFEDHAEAEVFADGACQAGGTWRVHTVIPPMGSNRKAFIELMQSDLRKALAH